MSYVLYGDSATGKTRIARKLARYLGLRDVVDGADADEAYGNAGPDGKTLYVTNVSPPARLQRDPFCVSISSAMRMLEKLA